MLAENKGTAYNTDMIAKHVIFRGRVQGVGFRYTARRTASQYQLAGFVRNVPDGTVEMWAQGPASDVEACIRDIQDYFGDYIRDAQSDEQPLDPRYTDFRVRY